MLPYNERPWVPVKAGVLLKVVLTTQYSVSHLKTTLCRGFVPLITSGKLCKSEISVVTAMVNLVRSSPSYPRVEVVSLSSGLEFFCKKVNDFSLSAKK